MMRHRHPTVPAASLVLLATATIALAEPPADQGKQSLPLASAAPEGDYLPPLSPGDQSAAALRMLGVSALALTAIALMLRFLLKHDERLANEPSPADDLVRRARAALDKVDEDARGPTE